MSKNNMGMNPLDVAKWLHEADDEAFAETFVYLDKFSRERKENPRVEAEDMRHFDLTSAVSFIKDVLDEILFSPEIQEGAWWKKGVA